MLPKGSEAVMARQHKRPVPLGSWHLIVQARHASNILSMTVKKVPYLLRQLTSITHWYISKFQSLIFCLQNSVLKRVFFLVPYSIHHNKTTQFLSNHTMGQIPQLHTQLKLKLYMLQSSQISTISSFHTTIPKPNLKLNPFTVSHSVIQFKPLNRNVNVEKSWRIVPWWQRLFYQNHETTPDWGMKVGACGRRRWKRSC